METTELINGIINEEFTDVSLYRAEAALFADKIIGGGRMAREFLKFADEELEHARALMSLTGKVQAAPARNIRPGNSLRQCLKTHQDRETLSVTFYKRLLQSVSDPGQKLLFRGILAQETEHLSAVTKYLKRIR